MVKETIKMAFRKSTPGTHVYDSIEEDSAIRTQYVNKSALPKDPPKTITVTIEYED